MMKNKILSDTDVFQEPGVKQMTWNGSGNAFFLQINVKDILIHMTMLAIQKMELLGKRVILSGLRECCLSSLSAIFQLNRGYQT
jgi:hypothetical protein